MSDTVAIGALTVPELIATSAGQWPDADLLVFGEQRISYARAEAESRRLAALLLAAGIGKGSHIGIVFPNSPAYVVSLLAVLRIGAVVVPVSTFSTPPELKQLIVHADLAGLIIAEGFLNHDYREKLREALPGIETGPPYALGEAPFLRRVWVWSEQPPAWADSALARPDVSTSALVESAEQRVTSADVGAIIYTSGSTGEPKGVIHSQGNLLRQSVKQARDNDYRNGDRIFTSMPFFWVGGLTYKLLPAMQVGATLLGCEGGAPGDMLAFIERERASLFLGWPYISRALEAAPDFADYDLSSLRGGSLHRALAPGQRPEDPTLIITGLGMTETAGPHTEGQRQRLEPALRGSVGWPAPGMEHRIVDPRTGRDLPDGQMGELWVRGDTLMLGLYKRDSVFEPDGWYRTRDLVVRRDGHFFFEGRLDDMVKIKGANVSPREVESVLLAMEGAVFALVSSVGSGEQMRLGAIVLMAGELPAIESIRDFLRQKLSAYKVPSIIRVLPASELPMRSSGKVDRLALIERLTENDKKTA